MSNVAPLDDLEVFELLQALYPNDFPDDKDETWDRAQAWFSELNTSEMKQLIADMAMKFGQTLYSHLTKKSYKVFGVHEEHAATAIIKREINGN